MLEVRGLGVRYGKLVAARDVTFELDRGGIGCLLGPSGCGKTSVLRAIAGFVPPATGSVAVDGVSVATAARSLPPEERRIGIVLQDLALFPHLDVTANIAFGLRRRDRAGRRERVAELLALTGLEAVARSYPHELSGGQQQRVAIARAMAPRPRLLLLDEPFSSLDPELRERLPRELRRLFREADTTVLLVTHDQHEAFAMADRIGLIREGRLLQWDSGYGLYHRPASRAVAHFIGKGVLLPGRMVDATTVATVLGPLRSDEPVDGGEGARVDVLLRPDDVVHDDASDFRARIVDRTFRGAHFLYTVELEDGTRLLCYARSHHDHRPGEHLGIRLNLPHVVVFPTDPPGGPDPAPGRRTARVGD